MARERRSIEDLKLLKRRILLLLKTYTVSEVADKLDLPYIHVYRIKQETRYTSVDVSMTVNELGLMRSSNNKRCRRCGDVPRIMAKSLLCVQCELEDRARVGDGSVVITEYKDL